MAETLTEKMDRLKADTIRGDGRLERHCEHGCGHPIGHVSKWEDWMGTHGCCGEGCCGKWIADGEPTEYE